jgi:integrase
MRLEASGISRGPNVDVWRCNAAAAGSTPTLGKIIPLYLKAHEAELAQKAIRSRATLSRPKSRCTVRIDGIGRKDIMAYRQSRSPVARTALSGLYGWCVDRGHADVNPTLSIASRAKNGARERVLSEAELAAVWKACDGGNDYAQIVRLLILTGSRRTEIGDLAWSEIDLAKRQIELPPRRTK